MKQTVLIPALICALLTSACGGGGGGGSSVSPGGGSSNSSSNTTTSGTAGCSGNAVFSTPPIALSSVLAWDPLGAMQPPGHTFPTDHQYLYFANPNTPSTIVNAQVVAPGNMRIFQIWQESGNGTNGFDLWFQPCAQIMGRISVSSISSDLAAAAGPINQNCQNFGYTLCQKSVTIDVQAGQVIGSVSNANGYGYALDWWLWDNRTTLSFVDQAMFSSSSFPGFTEANIVPASAYFTSAVTPQIDAVLGSIGIQRTVAPVDGTIAVDVANTARGYWFNPNNTTQSSDAALAPDEVQPNVYEVISLGISQTNITQGGGSGFRGNFTPVTTGLVNRAFESIGADGNVYCYTPVVENQQGATGVVLLQMPTASTIKIEVQSVNGGSCSTSQPWAFTANAVTFQR